MNCFSFALLWNYTKCRLSSLLSTFVFHKSSRFLQLKLVGGVVVHDCIIRLGPIQICTIFRTVSSRFPIKNSQHCVKQPTCEDLNTTDIYLWSFCSSSLFSCVNFSRSLGSCRDALMRSSVDNSLLFTLAYEPVKETFPLGWMEFDICDLRNCAMLNRMFTNTMWILKLVSLPDVSFPRSKAGSWILWFIKDMELKHTDNTTKLCETHK